MGLLLLRAAVGIAGMIEGGLFLADRASAMLGNWTVGLALSGSGVLLLIGLLTPLASVVAALTTTAVGGAWLPPPHTNLYNAPLPVVLLVVIAVSIGFLGPGSFSVDCRLFGRREIIIPRGQRPKE